MKVLVTGAAGMLGAAMTDALRHYDDYEVIATGRSDHGAASLAMDIGDWDGVMRTIEDNNPDLVMHLAAETDVDRCEREPDHAFAVNAFGTENVARACREYGAELVYISTANVFDGEKIEPYTEYDTPGSVNAYGRSKLANALFSLELAQRLDGSGVTSNVIHPGLVKTNIARTAPAVLRVAFELFGGVIAKTPAQGAATQVYVATNSVVDGVSGAYFEDCNPVTVSGDHHIFDESMAARLWATAEDMAEGYLL